MDEGVVCINDNYLNKFYYNHSNIYEIYFFFPSCHHKNMISGNINIRRQFNMIKSIKTKK